MINTFLLCPSLSLCKTHWDHIWFVSYQILEPWLTTVHLPCSRPWRMACLFPYMCAFSNLKKFKRACWTLFVFSWFGFCVYLDSSKSCHYFFDQPCLQSVPSSRLRKWRVDVILQCVILEALGVHDWEIYTRGLCRWSSQLCGFHERCRRIRLELFWSPLLCWSVFHSYCFESSIFPCL